MTDRQPPPEWPQGPRQRIGPALRDLRTRRGWSLTELSRQSGISSSYLSRLEHGRSDPSYTTLRKLADAFEVDLTFFTGYDQTSRQLEGDLAALLQRLNVPSSTWNEFAELGLEARGALIDALRRLTVDVGEAPPRERDLEAFIRRHGLPDSVDQIREGLKEFGLPAIAYAHALVQLEELPGERLMMLDRLPIASSDSLQNPTLAFQRIFGFGPPNASLIRWWLHAIGSAVDATSRAYGARYIYSLPSLLSEMNSGTWGSRFVIDREMARNRIQAMITSLEGNPRSQIGLLDEEIPLNMLLKNHQEVLVLRYADSWEDPPDVEPRFGLRFSRPDIVGIFFDYFNETWDRIPSVRKDSEAVIAWFKARLAELD